jgi:hypothetical protein
MVVTGQFSLLADPGLFYFKLFEWNSIEHLRNDLKYNTYVGLHGEILRHIRNMDNINWIIHRMTSVCKIGYATIWFFLQQLILRGNKWTSRVNGVTIHCKEHLWTIVHFGQYESHLYVALSSWHEQNTHMRNASWVMHSPQTSSARYGYKEGMIWSYIWSEQHRNYDYNSQ